MPRTVYARFDRTRLNDRTAVIEFFRGIPAEIMRRLGNIGVRDNAFCSTVLLLRAEEVGELTWQQMAELIARKINYPVIFEEVAGEIDDHLEYYSQSRDGYDGFDIGFYLENLRCVPLGSFIRLVAALTDSLRGERAQGFVLPDGDLASKGPGYWVDPDQFRYFRSEPHRASEYLRHVEQDERFIAEARGIYDLLPVGAHFRLMHGQDLEVGVVANSQGTDLDALSGNRDTCAQVENFLRRWCLGGCWRQAGSDRLTVFLAEVSVRVSSGDMGINVFIPRFYAFSHIKNYADRDFAVLKYAMESLHVPMKDDRLPKDQIDNEARRIRRELLATGMAPGEAWDETRRRMGWAETTMESRIGSRPTGRNEH